MHDEQDNIHVHPACFVLPTGITVDKQQHNLPEIQTKVPPIDVYRHP